MSRNGLINGVDLGAGTSVMVRLRIRVRKHEDDRLYGSHQPGCGVTENIALILQTKSEIGLFQAPPIESTVRLISSDREVGSRSGVEHLREDDSI